MRHSQAFTVGAALLLVGSVLTMPSRAGSLRTGDLNATGDQLLTIDTNTGLEFLDVSATVGLSYNQTLETSFVTQEGFRFATLDEFTQLLVDAGFTNFSGDFNTEDQAAAENLLENFLGETIPPGEPFTLDAPGTRFDAVISDGFYSFVTNAPGTPAGLANVVGVDYQSAALGLAPQDQTRVILSLNQVPFDVPPPIAGGLLVRRSAAVPEPSSLLLLTLGGLSLGTLLVRRRRGEPVAGSTD